MTTTPWGPSATPYPVRLEGVRDPRVSRWLWLVKWLLAVPHYIALAVLGLAGVVVWLWALGAIVVTGRYPRAAFDYLLGLLRWSWRLLYYLYNAGATDAYPPFTLAEVPDYPARLDVAYPGELSRGLALVKWLLAIPHYVAIAVLFGFTSRQPADERGLSVDWSWPGIVPLLVLVALLAVLASGVYPPAIYDLVMGFNRYRYRVLAYVMLMTDEYPPFRLDRGPDEPGPPGGAWLPPGASGTPSGS